MSYRRDDLINLKPYMAETIDVEVILDANESYRCYPQSVMTEILNEIGSMELTRYPRDNYEGICKSYSDYIGIAPSKILAGNGSDELIQVLLNAFLNKGDKLATISPDFVMYDVYSKISAVEKFEIYKREEDVLDIDTLIESINNSGCKIFMFSNPNNPTGRIFKRQEVIKILESVDCLVVADEAYMEFANESVKDLIDDYDNLLVLRTCSKGLGLAAIRLGFCLCNEDLRYEMLRAKSPYNVNGLTVAVAKTILNNQEIIKSNVEDVIEQRDLLYTKLDKFDELDCIKPYGNFIYINSNRSGDIYNGLLERGIKIKYMKDKSAMRITIGEAKDNIRIIDGVKEILSNG